MMIEKKFSLPRIPLSIKDIEDYSMENLSRLTFDYHRYHIFNILQSFLGKQATAYMLNEKIIKSSFVPWMRIPKGVDEQVLKMGLLLPTVIAHRGGESKARSYLLSTQDDGFSPLDNLRHRRFDVLLSNLRAYLDTLPEGEHDDA